VMFFFGSVEGEETERCSKAIAWVGKYVSFLYCRAMGVALRPLVARLLRCCCCCWLFALAFH